MQVRPLLNTVRDRDPALGGGLLIHVGTPEFRPPPQSLVESFSRPTPRGSAMRGRGRFGLVVGSLRAAQPILVVSWFVTEDRSQQAHVREVAPEIVDWTPAPCSIAAAWTKTGLNYCRVSLPSQLVREWIRMHPPREGYDLAHRLLPRRRVGDIRWQSPLHVLLTVELYDKEIHNAVDIE